MTALAPPWLLIVVISYSDRSGTLTTLEWLNQLLEPPAVPDDVSALVWDNASHELSSLGSGRVTYVSSREGNIGFGAAVNAAVATAERTDRLLLLNTDVELDSEQLKLLLERLRRCGPDEIWAPTLLNPDGSQQTAANQLFLRTPWQEAKDMFGFPAPTPDSQSGMFYLRGAVFSISREAFDRAQGFDRRFFLYGEEADLCFRLRESTTLVLDDQVRIVHLGSQGSDGKSPFALWHALKARAILQRRYHGAMAGRLIRLAGFAYYFLYRATHRKRPGAIA